jgi:type II secretory pathway pseudopilin PulG
VVPAIQRARDEARRTQTMDNLRQMGVALQSYAGAHNSFPPGTVPRRADPRSKGEEQKGTF